MKSFHPPARILLGAGPSEVPERIRLAAARPMVGHLDPAFQELMEEVRGALARIMRAPRHACLPLPAPATAAMEAAFMNLLEPGDVAVVGVNGLFGARMAEIAERLGAEVVRVAADWGRALDPERVEAALWARGAKVLAFVHAETSTGVLNDAPTLCRLAREHGALSIVDCVTSLGGLPVDAEGWGADVVYGASQKCLSAPPGQSPTAVSKAALAAVAARTGRPRTFAFDYELLLSYWGEAGGGRAYHHTAPVSAVYALHEALVAFEEEGAERVFDRHRRAHVRLLAGLEALGLELLPEPRVRLPQLNVVRAPEGVDEARVRGHLLRRYGIEIGAGLGALRGRVWRIGLMGASAREGNVLALVAALGDALGRQGRTVSVEAALAAAEGAD